MESFADLLLRAIPRLRRHAGLLLGDMNLADEIVGRCLSNVIERLDIGHTESAVGLALLKTLYTYCSVAGTASAAIASIDRSTAEGARSDAGGARDSSTTEAVFERLSFEQRAILLLISVERFSYEDAAEILAVPLAQIPGKVAAARKAFRALAENVNAAAHATV